MSIWLTNAVRELQESNERLSAQVTQLQIDLDTAKERIALLEQGAQRKPGPKPKEPA